MFSIIDFLVNLNRSTVCLKKTFNPFFYKAPFLWPLKTSEKLTVFWCFFRGLEKGWLATNVLMEIFIFCALSNSNLIDSTNNLWVFRYLACTISQAVSGFEFYDGWVFLSILGQEKQSTFLLTILLKFMSIL